MTNRYMEGFDSGFKKAQAEGQVEIDRLRAAQKQVEETIRARAKMWNHSAEKAAHEDCALSIAEECEDILSIITRIHK